MANIVDIADLDCIFLTYGEPQAEEFWVKIQNMVPWVTRVDGIKGSDAAHKAAADASTTDRFILIDGDNMPDPDFFNQQLELHTMNENKVFRWKARNHINGLMYGNGGISCWTKDFVYNMKTHEASNGDDTTSVEFCFDKDYWAMYDCYSTTYPNQSAEQAWRAGFREGVKMCLNRGTKTNMIEFESMVVTRNYDNLCIWMSVGDDVEHGESARAGAMLGTYLTMIGNFNRFKDFDYRTVQDFGALECLWKRYENYTLEISTELCGSKGNGQSIAMEKLETALTHRLGLDITSLTPEASKFFKAHYKSGFRNKGIMVTEVDVIREQEGW